MFLRHTRMIIIAWIMITVALGFAAARVDINPEVLRLLPRDDAAHRLIDTYGQVDKNVNHLIIVLRAAEPFSTIGLQAIEVANQAISSHPLIVSSVTPLNLPSFSFANGRLQLAPAMPGGRAPRSDIEAERLQAALQDAPEARNLVIADGGTALALVYGVEVIPDYQEFLASIQPSLDALANHFQVIKAGWIPLHQATLKALYRDPPILGIVAIAVVILTLLAALGRLPVTIAVVAVAVSAAVWSVGLMSLTSIPIGIITLVVPILVIALTSSYGVHLAFRFRLRPGDIPSAAAEVMRPVTLAALTTIAGFSTLLLSTIPRLREFGLISAAGVCAGAFLCLVVLPAILSALHRQQQPEAPEVLARGTLAHLQHLSITLTKRPGLALGAGILVICLFIAVLPRIRYETDFAGNVRGDTEAVAGNAIFMREFGSFIDLNLTLRAPDDTIRYFAQPHILSVVTKLEKQMAEHSNVSHVSSFTTSLAALRRAVGVEFNSDLGSDDRPLIELAARMNTLTARSRTGPGLSSDGQTLTSRLWVMDGSTGGYLYETGMAELASFVRQSVDKALPEVQSDLWGWSMFALRLSELLRRDQVITTIASALLVVVLTAIALRSFALGLAAVAPLAVGIIATAAMMGIADLPFDALTVMIASLAIGIGIDDALHLLVWYQRERGCGAERTQAMRSAVAHAGGPILITSGAICFGLLPLVGSTFVPVARFGLLLSIAIAATTAGALTVLPAILTIRFRRTGPPSVPVQQTVIQPQHALKPGRMPTSVHQVIHKRVPRRREKRLVPQATLEHAGRHDRNLLSATSKSEIDRTRQKHRPGTEGDRKFLVEP